MACCNQATHHYLSQFWPRSVSLYGVNIPQCVDLTSTARVSNKSKTLFSVVFHTIFKVSQPMKMNIHPSQTIGTIHQIFVHEIVGIFEYIKRVCTKSFDVRPFILPYLVFASNGLRNIWRLSCIMDRNYWLQIYSFRDCQLPHIIEDGVLYLHINHRCTWQDGR